MAGKNAIRISSLSTISTNMETAIDSFLSYCRAKNLSENTIVYYNNRLNAFRLYIDDIGDDIAPINVTPQIVRSFVANEAESKSPATANHSIITLRAFFNYLTRDGFLETNPVLKVEKLKRRKVIIDTFSSEQIEAVISSCKKDFSGIRDRAIILTLLDCGLRASELCGLKISDMSWNDLTMLVLGKGDKERIVPFGNTTRQALTQYLAQRGNLETNNLFVTCYGDPVDRHRVREIIKHRCRLAGISGVRCSPHTFRHTFAVMYLRAGGDVFSLQKLLGHSDLSMTRRYAELSQTDVQEKHRLYSPADKLGLRQTSGRKRLR